MSSLALDVARTPDGMDRPALEHTSPVVYRSLLALERWVEDHRYEAYEPFDGLSSPLRRLTFGNLFLDRLLMQTVRQSPVNLRPLLGIKPLPSTKGRGYMAAGYFAMYRLSADVEYLRKAVRCLEWLVDHKSPKFREYSWANHFDFASRAGRYSKHESIIVWSSLIGQAFLDGYEILGEQRFLDVAESVCRWILALPRQRTDSGTCLSYYAIAQSCVHNANMLGAAMLARTWRLSPNPEYLDAAAEAVRYTCTRQREDGSWLYGEAPMNHWIDGFHTGYNLDSLKAYIDSTGDDTYSAHMRRGLDFYVQHFFRADGCPRYYHDRTQPIDSQCAAQGIETLSRFAEIDPACLDRARQVAKWSIQNMQDADGHFYYRVYPLLKAKAPMMHWAQATMYRALSELLTRESQGRRS